MLDLLILVVGLAGLWFGSELLIVDAGFYLVFLGVAAALALGAVAGLYPAVRAARLDPAEAVRPA